MAAEIKQEGLAPGSSKKPKPELVGKIEGCPDVINMAITIPREHGVISVSDDKTVRVWLKRDSGQYWPSICHTMPAEASAMDYNAESRVLFVAQDNGTISGKIPWTVKKCNEEIVKEEVVKEEVVKEETLKEEVVIEVVVKEEVVKEETLKEEVVIEVVVKEEVVIEVVVKDEEFELTEDFNRLIHHKDYIAHQGRVMAVKFSSKSRMLLTCSKDRYFMGHCTDTGRRLSGYQTDAACLCLEYDEQSKYAFVGDYSGQISVLKLKDNTLDLVTTLKGHAGSVQSLCWDSNSQLLFSGSFDQSVVVWDIGGKKGTAFELQGHKDKVLGLAYARISHHLLSGSSDGMLGIWNMQIKRVETPEWAESDVCQKCDSPFFWNFRKMWAEKKVGTRQHHCRRCGKALCHSCSGQVSRIPLMGYEYDVRVCDVCYAEITPKDKEAHATFHDLRHEIVHMYLDESRKLLLTSGKERVMKLWDMSSVLDCSSPGDDV